MTIEMFVADAEATKAAAAAKLAEALADNASLRELEADFTPRPVVRAILHWLFEHVLDVMHYAHHNGDLLLVQRRGVNRVLSRPTPVLRVLDICAGAGVWASEFRKLMAELGIPVHITAVEIDEEREREYLSRHADEVFWGGWRLFVEQCTAAGRWFDITIGNPGFKRARAPKVTGELRPDLSMPARIMEISGAVVLYMSQSGWTKTASGFEVRRAYNPAYAVDIPGGVGHRAGVNPETGKRWSTDSVPYSVTIWIGKMAGPHVGMCQTGMLEPFDGRSWTEELRPGAEPVEWLRNQGIPYLETVK